MDSHGALCTGPRLVRLRGGPVCRGSGSHRRRCADLVPHLVNAGSGERAILPGVGGGERGLAAPPRPRGPFGRPARGQGIARPARGAGRRALGFPAGSPLDADVFLAAEARPSLAGRGAELRRDRGCGGGGGGEPVGDGRSQQLRPGERDSRGAASGASVVLGSPAFCLYSGACHASD